MEKIKGVNLGNWLVLEKWMLPEMFAGTGAEDEVWLNRKVSSDKLKEKMRDPSSLRYGGTAYAAGPLCRCATSPCVAGRHPARGGVWAGRIWNPALRFLRAYSYFTAVQTLSS